MTTNRDQELENLREELKQVREEYKSFLYTVSHDLNAPIRHINSFSEIILKENSDQFDEKTNSYFGFVTSAGENLAAMLEGLLKLSRLNTKQKPVIEIDVAEVISDVLEFSLRDELETRNASFDVGEMPIVTADPEQLGILFECLISNSLKFVPKDVAPEIKIFASENEGYWQFILSDNGIGIEEKHCKTVFEVFKRAVTPDQFPGIGIGLTLAKKIVERHGGSIAIQSEKSGGAAVTFNLGK